MCQLSNDCWPETVRTLQLLKLIHSRKDGEHRSPQKKGPSQMSKDDPQLIACASTSPENAIETHGELPKPAVREPDDLLLSNEAMAKKLKVRAFEVLVADEAHVLRHLSDLVPVRRGLLLRQREAGIVVDIDCRHRPILERDKVRPILHHSGVDLSASHHFFMSSLCRPHRPAEPHGQCAEARVDQRLR